MPHFCCGETNTDLKIQFYLHSFLSTLSGDANNLVLVFMIHNFMLKAVLVWPCKTWREILFLIYYTG